MQRSSVHLPEPLGPMDADDRALPTSRLTPRSTSSRPKRLCTSSSCSIAPLELAAPSAAIATPPAIPVGGGCGSERRSPPPPLRSRLPLLARDQHVDQPGQRDRHHQEEDRPEHQRRAVEALRLDVEACLRRPRPADHADQRSVLHQRDEVVQQRRDHLAHRLRDDHVAHRLAVAHSERARRLHLAPRDRLDPCAVDLGHVGAVGERERDDSVPERRRLSEASVGNPIDSRQVTVGLGGRPESRRRAAASAAAGSPRKTSM